MPAAASEPKTQLVSIDIAAEFIGISRRTIQRALLSGKAKFIDINGKYFLTNEEVRRLRMEKQRTCSM